MNSLKYAVGIDLGGTNIKGALINTHGEALLYKSCATDADKGAFSVVGSIFALIESMLHESGIDIKDTLGIGIGIPGMIDTRTGTVLFSGNLGWSGFSLAQPVSERFGVKVRTVNDASAAALGEMRFGSGRQYSDAVLITLGTGVGSGIVIGGRLFEGTDGAGAELGHMVICAGGEQCTCGRRGCLEAYASATALVREAKKALKAHPESRMSAFLPDADIERMDARIPFLCKDSDPVAAQVVDAYTDKLAEGIANIVNIFRPQAVFIGGGISNEGEGLLAMLREKSARMYFGGEYAAKTEILLAGLGNRAGVYGAAAILM